MEVHFAPEVEKRLNHIALQSARESADALVQDVVGGYINEVAQTREMLDSRYDELKSGRVKPIGGEEFFESLRRREDELLNVDGRRARLCPPSSRGAGYHGDLGVHRGR